MLSEKNLTFVEGYVELGGKLSGVYIVEYEFKSF